jgi:sulfate permease, SulP family
MMSLHDAPGLDRIRPMLDDVTAGVSNAFVYVPQGVGYAILAGVSPVYGLYTGFLPPILAAFTTGSVFMQVIATNELAIPIGRIAEGMDGAFTVEKLCTLTLLVGVFALLAGALRLGRVLRFISNSVMTGFVLGLMILLIVGQVANLAGYHGVLAGNDLQRLLQIAAQPAGIDATALGVGVASIVATALLLRSPLHRFAYLITLVGASALVTLFAGGRIPLAGGGARVAAGFPWPQMPDLQAIPELLLPAFALTIVGLSFGTGVAQTFPAPDGRVGNPSRDFLGQGIANFVSAFFQCMPSGGSMSRTAYLVEAGAKTRWVHVFTGLAMLGIVLLAADLAARIPLAVVAGLLIVLGYTAIDFGRVRLVWQINRVERWTMMVTAALTLVMSPPLAILAGVFLSFVSFVQASANTVALTRLVRSDDGLFAEGAPSDGFASHAVTTLRVHGPLFFAGVDNLEHRLLPMLDTRDAVLVLSFRGYTSVGSTGLLFLERFAHAMRMSGNRLLLADVSDEIRRELERTGVMAKLGADSVFAAQEDPNASITAAHAAAVQSRER